MTFSLGGLTLSDNLYLDGLDKAPAVGMSSRRTLGGRIVNQIGPQLIGGRSLQLQSELHITHAQEQSIKSMEAIGQPVTLVCPRGSYTVFISGIDLTPDTQLANPDSATDLWYSGTINLIEG